MRELQREFSFADTCRPEKEKTRLRSTGRGQAEFSMLKPLAHGRDRRLLTDDQLLQTPRQRAESFD
jgi:hypothetical protein